MALLYLNKKDQVKSTTDDNPLFNDKSIGVGRWVQVEDSVWIANQGNNNQIIDGVFIPNHIPDVQYWLNEVEYTLKHPHTLPEGATFEKPSGISAREERELRDKLLSLSDWAVLPDAPLTDAQKQEWQAYRQALRDIPQQSGFPEFVVVPEEPTKVIV